MNTREIFEDVLLVGKSVILEFQNQKDLNSFKSHISVLRIRTNSQLAAIGEGTDVMEGKSLVCEILKRGPPLQVRCSIAEKEKRETKFQILKIEDQNEQPV